MGLLNPMHDNNWGQEPGRGRDDTCDHGLSRSWKVDVCEKKSVRVGCNSKCSVNQYLELAVSYMPSRPIRRFSADGY